MKLVWYNEYLVSTMDTDGPVLYHSGLHNYSAKCAPVHFQLFMCDVSSTSVVYK